MVVLDRIVYQVHVDGTVHVADPMALTPFANVAFFEPDMTFELRGIESLDQLQKEIDRRLINRNIFYAIRVDGIFDTVKVRTLQLPEKGPGSLDLSGSRSQELNAVEK